MLYAESHTGHGVERALVFSDTDSVRELDSFRCLVHAPRQAMTLPTTRASRPYLTLFGAPRAQALAIIVRARIFETPIEREAWERSQPHILKRGSPPFTP
jgi:hypothetical protein